MMHKVWVAESIENLQAILRALDIAKKAATPSSLKAYEQAEVYLGREHDRIRQLRSFTENTVHNALEVKEPTHEERSHIERKKRERRRQQESSGFFGW